MSSGVGTLLGGSAGPGWGLLIALSATMLAALTTALRMLLGGILVPKITVDRIEKSYRDEITRMITSHTEQVTSWRATVDASEAARASLLAQQAKLIEAVLPTWHARKPAGEQASDATT